MSEFFDTITFLRRGGSAPGGAKAAAAKAGGSALLRNGAKAAAGLTGAAVIVLNTVCGGVPGMSGLLAFAAGGAVIEVQAAEVSDVQEVTLRVCSWEEYIDEGDWDEDEVIDLESGDIFGENDLITDFEEWYYETYGIRVTVEYSTFGTNEDLYNMLTLGDTFDLICPSEYMFMKLMSEDALQPLSEEFFDETDEYNYYIKGVSPYIQEVFDSHEVNGEAWSAYAAGYMWGVTGIVYNPEVVSEEEASTWTILTNPDYAQQITIKDSVRECYFAAIGALNSELLTSEEFLSADDYSEQLEEIMNDTSQETIDAVQVWLQEVKDNVYSFEVDSGKADMITGKVVANYQWSGDAVYTMDQADEDDYTLAFAVPDEVTNIYFDGWVMLKSGIDGNEAVQHAAEAWINFMSRPDNAIRNMYYIGYTSCISGEEGDERIYEYLEWCYGAEDEDEGVEYDVSWFFTGDTESTDEDYVVLADEDAASRQLAAQYPSTDVIRRSSIMRYFNDEQSEATNAMWVNVRCYSVYDVPWWGWILIAALLAVIVWMAVRKVRMWRKAGRT